MKLTVTQAWDIWMAALSPLSQRQSRGLIWGTNRMQRRALHVLHRAEKKRAKRLRAKRRKCVRPIVRLTPVGFIPYYFGKELFEFMVQVGDDTETYEPEAIQHAIEEVARREDRYCDDFLSEEAADRDVEQVLLDEESEEDSVCDDDFEDRWWEYENDPVEHDDLSRDDGF